MHVSTNKHIKTNTYIWIQNVGQKPGSTAYVEKKKVKKFTVVKTMDVFKVCLQTSVWCKLEPLLRFCQQREAEY